MKKQIAVLAILFISSSLFAQQEVTFTFIETKNVLGANPTINIYINGEHSVSLDSGDTTVYRTTLDPLAPVTLQARFNLLKKEITFYPDSTLNCNLEVGFSGTMLNLDLISGGSVNPSTTMFSRLNINRDNASVTYTEIRENESDTIRQNWLRVGGKIKYESVVGNISFLTYKGEDYKMKGIGGNLMISEEYLNFKVPDYLPGLRKWHSSVYGASLSIMFMVSEITSSNFEDPFSSSSLGYVISPDLGYTFGIGKFKSPTKWRGIAFEFKYSPSLILTLPLEEGATTDYNFNFLGFGFDMNTNSFTSNASKLAPKAQSKFTLFVLPPIKDIPLTVSVGYGLTFYRQRSAKRFF